MAVALLQEDRLHARLEELVVERRGRTQRHQRRSRGCEQGGHYDQFYSTSGHANLPQFLILVVNAKS